MWSLVVYMCLNPNPAMEPSESCATIIDTKNLYWTEDVCLGNGWLKFKGELLAGYSWGDPKFKHIACTRGEDGSNTTD